MKIFITGISTEVGKTITSAIVVESLKADYWKPIQAGDLENSDSSKVKRLISNSTSTLYSNSYKLNTPASPHLAAKIDGIEIKISAIKTPETKNNLVIEGAGGLFVPLNDKDYIIDLIKPEYKIVLVSRHYLGSINHTILSIEALKSRGLEVAGIIFNGKEDEATEAIIESKFQIPVIGRIEEEPYFDQDVILDYAEQFRENLEAMIA
ncbi:dethiobiotin synthase [Flavobacterium ardleyense]|uniref:dethiobiotin synthase n=1 Tax=Flavobacterium ardleyense TaxID=2038737 RepID=UPI00298C9253|nr:dethiobiotin synthase [Flavobacterium ardleyense]